MNTIIIFALLLLTGYIIYWYLFVRSKEKTESTEVTDTTLDYVVEDITRIFSEALRENLESENLSREELKAREKSLTELRDALSKAPYGDKQSKRILVHKIQGIISDPAWADKYGKSNEFYEKIIPFNHPDRLSAYQMHEILIYLYEKKYHEKALDKLILNNEWEKQHARDGELKYEVTKEVLIDTFRKVFSGQSDLGAVKLSASDKLNIVSQIIYASYQGFSVIDSIYAMDIDEIDCGVSGIPDNGLDIKYDGGGDIHYSYQSIWVMYHGRNIQLTYLAFPSRDEFIRVCDNIYRFNSAEALSEKTGKIVGQMPDGSRISVARPPFAECYNFYLRKFGAEKRAKKLSEILPPWHHNPFIPVVLARYAMKGELNTLVTGQAGSGKTTTLKSMVHDIDPGLNIRVQELVSELNLRFAYPSRNIASFQQTESVSSQEGINFLKKANAAVVIEGEIASAQQAAEWLETAMVNSRIGLGTQHAGNPEELVESLTNNLMQLGLFGDKKDAERMVATVVDINIGQTFTKGDRHIKYITEIHPQRDERYPSDGKENENLELTTKAVMDSRKFMRDMTNPKQYRTVPLMGIEEVEGSLDGEKKFVLIEHEDGSYGFSKTMRDKIEEKLSLSEVQTFRYDMEMLERAYKNPAGKEERAWIENVMDWGEGDEGRC